MDSKKKRRVLVLDGLNQFIRGYIVSPAISSNGEPCGGTISFLRTLQKIIRETSPDEVIVAWDAPGGSLGRKALVSDYKDGRSPLRLNRNIRQLTEKQEAENKDWQLLKLFEMLNKTPVMQLLVEGVEADDLIAYVVQHEKYKDCEKVIVSSDKDFYQLLDGNTVMMRPIQKEVLNRNSIIEKFQIHPNNFALARAITGDSSDNLPGVRGLGLPTVAKRFPFLVGEQRYSFDDLVEYIGTLEKPSKAHESLKEGRAVVELNYKMMQLTKPLVGDAGTEVLEDILANFVPAFNQTNFSLDIIREGFGEVNFNNMFINFYRMIKGSK